MILHEDDRLDEARYDTHFLEKKKRFDTQKGSWMALNHNGSVRV